MIIIICQNEELERFLQAIERANATNYGLASWKYDHMIIVIICQNEEL